MSSYFNYKIMFFYLNIFFNFNQYQTLTILYYNEIFIDCLIINIFTLILALIISLIIICICVPVYINLKIFLNTDPV